jgi:hypothetical protein
MQRAMNRSTQPRYSITRSAPASSIFGIAFGPEDTAAMTTAFEEVLKRLNVADHEARIATSVAKKIVRLAKRGERNRHG